MSKRKFSAGQGRPLVCMVCETGMAKARGQVDGVIIQRVRAQHGSLLVVVPIAIRRALELKVGDYLVFNGHSDQGVVELSKFKRRGDTHARLTRNSNRKVKGRRT